MILNNGYYLAAFIPTIIIILRSLIVYAAALIADNRQVKVKKEASAALVGASQL
jgi:hypothetical protein